jgi:hypothetical protein
MAVSPGSEALERAGHKGLDAMSIWTEHTPPPRSLIYMLSRPTTSRAGNMMNCAIHQPAWTPRQFLRSKMTTLGHDSVELPRDALTR